ncbi:unnamed protein product [Lepeophtheirus salmonis]|uniref:(salmon louse) hypothetical protein n=1 Tax=Lepeophtheirus salmonis TaxID=72036 RepID=A0A0K2VA48_LEPSM|nr:unnamed protein product [Lepeophtheirus salmonis]CAF3030126.1 unnamed protein product [Lepeophtheirus salmonis]
MNHRFSGSSPKASRGLPSPGGHRGSGTPKPSLRRSNPNSPAPHSSKISPPNSVFPPNKQAMLQESSGVSSPSSPSVPNTGAGGSASPSVPVTPSSKSRVTSKPTTHNTPSGTDSCRMREFSTSSNNSLQQPTTSRSGGSGLLTASLSPLGPHHKSVEEFIDAHGSNEPKTYIQGNCPEIISNGMTELHNKIGEFVIGFENVQKSSNLLLSQWEETLEDVENYSKKLRDMKEMFKCRITQLNSTLKSK